MGQFNCGKILEILPHRYPFLMLDQIIKYDPGKYGLGIKNVSVNEPYFQGHFPDKAIMPGVLVIEACAQLLGIVCADLKNINRQHQFLASVKEFNFLKPIEPGDRMVIEVKVGESGFGLIQGAARVKTKKGLMANGILVNTNIK